ncbi:hypothetical protein FACS189467_2960 [Bacteroidia bacterium]|nr:hypothetical protein FACS189467_2960 [Bacteroidia bacterium]
MKTNIFSTALLSIGVAAAIGGCTATVHDSGQTKSWNITYKLAEQPMLSVLEFDQMKCIQLSIIGEFKGKSAKIVLKENVCKNGNIQTVADTNFFSHKFSSDTLEVVVISKIISPDSVRIALYGNYLEIRSDKKYGIPTKNNILMETYLADKDKQDKKIPLIAFTSGINKKIVINGETYEAIDFCGLRDAKVSPELWAKQFEIPNYIYFELEFIDE